MIHLRVLLKSSTSPAFSFYGHFTDFRHTVLTLLNSWQELWNDTRGQCLLTSPLSPNWHAQVIWAEPSFCFGTDCLKKEKKRGMWVAHGFVCTHFSPMTSYLTKYMCFTYLNIHLYFTIKCICVVLSIFMWIIFNKITIRIFCPTYVIYVICSYL